MQTPIPRGPPEELAFASRGGAAAPPGRPHPGTSRAERGAAGGDGGCGGGAGGGGRDEVRLRKITTAHSAYVRCGDTLLLLGGQM